MNEIVTPRWIHRTTRAAEGLARWRWSTSELVQLAAAGVLSAEDRLELIGGEIVPMSPAGRRHEVVREELFEWLHARAPRDVRVLAEPQLNLDVDTFTRPDVAVRPLATPTPDMHGPDVLLLVEVAESSLAYDLGAKAALYARHGVREYWVVDAKTLETWVHRHPGSTGYATVRSVPADLPLETLLLPASAFRLADLPLAPWGDP